uniref:B30.2/SPRY domain-containing protein n=1 Tax=Anabas testudineus TaxID=64144 RepID=A0A3Q1I7N8_ANATE
MSLQVCHCGWSKVTSHHGLRTHQGKMGCALKGAKVAEREQQYMWSTVGLSYAEKDIRMDVYSSLKTDSYSDMSLQVCHCGWAKMTTYQGLRIHQGKMGCTPKGMKIQKREQYDGKAQWKVEEEHIKQQITKRTIKKEIVAEAPGTKHRTSSALTTVAIKEEYKSYSAAFASSQRSSQKARNSKARYELRDFSTLPQVNRSVGENPTPAHLEAVVRPKDKKINRQTSSQISESGGKIGNLCKVKKEPKSPPMMPQHSSHTATISKPNHLLQDVTNVQVNKVVRKPPPPVPVHRENIRKDQMLSQNVPVPPRINFASAATIKEEPKPFFPISQQSFQRVTPSTSGSQLQDFCTGQQVNRLSREPPPHPPLAAVAQAQKKHRKDSTLSQNTQDSTTTYTHMDYATEEAAAKEDPKSSNEISEPDFSTGFTVQELAQMFSASTIQATAVQPKKKHREEPKVVKLQVQTFSAATDREAAARPKEEDRETQQMSQVPDRKSVATQRNPFGQQTTVTKDPKPPCESAQLSDFPTGIKVKDQARIFSATARQETVVLEKEKHREEPKLTQVKIQPQKLSSTTAQDTAVHTEENGEKDTGKTQEKEGKIPDDLKHKNQMKEEKMAVCRSYINIKDTAQPHQGSLDPLRMALWQRIDDVFSDMMNVVEDAKQKSHNLPISTLRTTTTTMMEQIHQKLDKLSSVELKWISRFSVDIKLDPTTAHRCLVSEDGMKVIDGSENQGACDTSRSPGSILGLNSLPTGKSYWEVEVSNKSGWILGVAGGNAKRKGKHDLSPDNSFWVIAHYENNEYTTLTAPPVRLSLKEKPQKVGVFVNYKERFVSFYNVIAQSHIYSFTECSFTGEIFPHFSVHS